MSIFPRCEAPTEVEGVERIDDSTIALSGKMVPGPPCDGTLVLIRARVVKKPYEDCYTVDWRCTKCNRIV